MAAFKKALEENPGKSKIQVYRDTFNEPDATWDTASANTLFKKIRRYEEAGKQIDDDDFRELKASLQRDLDEEQAKKKRIREIRKRINRLWSETSQFLQNIRGLTALYKIIEKMREDRQAYQELLYGTIEEQKKRIGPIKSMEEAEQKIQVAEREVPSLNRKIDLADQLLESFVQLAKEAGEGAASAYLAALNKQAKDQPPS